MSWEVESKCGIASCWISVGWVIVSVFSRCEEIVELMPREVNVVAVWDGAFVGWEGATAGWSDFGGDIISGLLVKRDEEGKLRGATGISFADVAIVPFRFRFNGRAGALSASPVPSVSAFGTGFSSTAVLLWDTGLEFEGFETAPFVAF